MIHIKSARQHRPLRSASVCGFTFHRPAALLTALHNSPHASRRQFYCRGANYIASSPDSAFFFFLLLIFGLKRWRNVLVLSVWEQRWWLSFRHRRGWNVGALGLFFFFPSSFFFAAHSPLKLLSLLFQTIYIPWSLSSPASILIVIIFVIDDIGTFGCAEIEKAPAWEIMGEMVQPTGRGG